MWSDDPMKSATDWLTRNVLVTQSERTRLSGYRTDTLHDYQA